MNSKLRELFKASFVNGGREISTGLDCQGLLLRAMEIYGHKISDTEVASYATEIVASAIVGQTKSQKWERIDKPEEGCVVTMALDSMRPDLVQHVGVYIGEDRFIHILEKRGVVTNRLSDRFFQQKIRGYYRWVGGACQG